MSIGLLIGVAQVILKEAWVRVEQGFRPGRELMLVKEETVIGRAEDCDLGLYGDNGVERKHARILLKDGRYMLYDESTPGGTFVNDQRITGSDAAALRAIVIRVSWVAMCTCSANGKTAGVQISILSPQASRLSGSG